MLAGFPWLPEAQPQDGEMAAVTEAAILPASTESPCSRAVHSTPNPQVTSVVITHLSQADQIIITSTLAVTDNSHIILMSNRVLVLVTSVGILSMDQLPGTALHGLHGTFTRNISEKPFAFQPPVSVGKPSPFAEEAWEGRGGGRRAGCGVPQNSLAHQGPCPNYSVVSCQKVPGHTRYTLFTSTVLYTHLYACITGNTSTW